MLPPVNSSMATLVAWSRALVGTQRREILRLLWGNIAHSRANIIQDGVVQSWLTAVLDMTKKQCAPQIFSSTKGMRHFQNSFCVVSRREPLHAAYHQSSFPGAGQRNCLRAVAWVAPGILNRASTPSTVGTVLEAATWQRR